MEFCVRKRQCVELSETLLEGNKDHLLYRARTDQARREIHVNSLGFTRSTGRSRCYVVSGHKKGRVALLRRANFLKKRLPGRVDTSGIKTTILSGKLWKRDII